MGVSALNALIWRMGDKNKDRKLEYLKQKY